MTSSEVSANSNEAPRFYDGEQVDVYVAELLSQIADLEGRVMEARPTVPSVLGAAVNRDHGAAVRRAIADAQARIDAARADAAKEASEVLAAARRQSEILIRSADEERSQILERSHSKETAIREQARTEARSSLIESREQARAIIADACDKAERLMQRSHLESAPGLENARRSALARGLPASEAKLAKLVGESYERIDALFDELSRSLQPTQDFGPSPSAPPVRPVSTRDEAHSRSVESPYQSMLPPRTGLSELAEMPPPTEAPSTAVRTVGCR